MAAIPTVAIKGRKNPSERWLVNQNQVLDTDQLWEDSDDAASATNVNVLEPEVNVTVAVDPDADTSVGVDMLEIKDPNDRRRRATIPASEFDPEVHELW